MAVGAGSGRAGLNRGPRIASFFSLSLFLINFYLHQKEKPTAFTTSHLLSPLWTLRNLASNQGAGLVRTCGLGCPSPEEAGLALPVSSAGRQLLGRPLLPPGPPQGTVLLFLL